MTPPVLVLRPSPGAEKTAARLGALGFRPISSPLLRYERVARIASADLQGVQAVALTSAAAARAAAEDVAAGLAPRSLFELPVYCVGDATAAAARRAGFRDAHSAAGDAAALSAALAALDPRAGALLHLRGVDVAAPLTPETALAMRARSLYAAHRTQGLSVDARRALDQEAAALAHSRRIAEALRDALGAASPRLTVFAISARAAEPLLEASGWTVRVAERPTEEALLRALCDRFDIQFG